MSRHRVAVHQLMGDGGAYLNVLEDEEMGHCGAVGVWGFAAGGYSTVILRNADGFFAVISFADTESRDQWLAPDAAVSFREGYTMTWLAGAPDGAPGCGRSRVMGAFGRRLREGDRVEILDCRKRPTGQMGTVTRVVQDTSDWPAIVDVQPDDGDTPHSNYADFFAPHGGEDGRDG